MRHILSLLLLTVTLTLSAQDSLNMRMLFHWDDPSIPEGTVDYFNQYNAVWGYAAGDREYAFLGSTLGVHVFDITDPVNGVLVDHVAGAFSGVGVVHREYKTYQHYLYTTSDQGPSTLQIIDLQYLPDSVHVVYDSNALLVRAHTFQIDTLNARLYTCGGSTEFSVFDISDPVNPVLLNNCEADVPWWGSQVGYVHDCFVRDNIVWTDDVDGLHVVDFTDAQSPVLLGSLTNYPGQGYNHSSWMNDAGTLLAMADETHGSPLKFVDATDLSDLQVVGGVTTGQWAADVVHNPYFTGDLLHAAYYFDGYWLWSVVDPQQPILLGYYDTSTVPNTGSYSGAWGAYPFLPSGHVLVSDMQTGLWVLDIDQATRTAAALAPPSFRISPALTQGLVNVMDLRASQAGASVEVIDADGTTILAMDMNSSSFDLDLSAWSDGLYVVRVKSDEGMHTQRIVKSSVR